MSRQATDRPHPLAGVARRFSAAGLVALAVGGAGFGLGSYTLVAMGSALGAVLLGYGALLRRGTRAVPRVNAAFELLSRGRAAEAREVLDQVRATSTHVVRAVSLQRALIALHEGDLDAALAAATAATGEATGLLTRGYERAGIASARGLIALVRAARGEPEEAEAAARAAEESEGAGPDAFARAELARNIVRAREGDHDAIARSMRERGTLMLESTLPRERALVRALRRMARARPRSVYREAQRPEDAAEPAGLSRWIATVLPEAAAYASPAAGIAEATDRSAPPAAKRKALATIADDRRRAASANKRPKGRLVALWIALIVMFLAIYSLLGSAPPEAAPEPVPDMPGVGSAVALGVVLLAVLAGVFALQLRRAVNKLLAVHRASLPIALRRYDEVRPELERIANGRLDQAGGAALAALGSIALRTARFEDALRAFDRGIARITRDATIRAASSDILLPQLIASRAFTLALLQRPDDAEAELALLGDGFPSFPYAASARLRVDLACAIARRDLSRAGAVARTRTPELPLGLHEDVLADVVLALAQPTRSEADQDERARVVSELDDDEELRRFVEAAMPGALAELRLPRARVAGEPLETATRDEAAEQETDDVDDAALAARRAT